jgi:hypothetical protein
VKYAVEMDSGAVIYKVLCGFGLSKADGEIVIQTAL